jgi:hypothetical protein
VILSFITEPMQVKLYRDKFTTYSTYIIYGKNSILSKPPSQSILHSTRRYHVYGGYAKSNLW